jgi:ribonuclease HI
VTNPNSLPGSTPPPRRKTKTAPETQGLPPHQTLKAILDACRISQWDLLLVGDGSGTGWNDACGWATALIDNHMKTGRFYTGGMNLGSINLAEQMPYFQAVLHWRASGGGKELLERRGVLHAHIVTDSQVVANHGAQACDFNQILPKTQGPLWAGWRELVREGFVFTFHWAPRESSLLNQACDMLASMARRAVMTQSRQFLSDELRQQLIQLDRKASRVGGWRPQEDPAAVTIRELQATLRELTGRLETVASQSALAVEAVQLTDPRTGQPIPVDGLY